MKKIWKAGNFIIKITPHPENCKETSSFNNVKEYWDASKSPASGQKSRSTKQKLLLDKILVHEGNETF